MAITVAIVEDNAEIGEELEHMLAESSGFECVCICRNTQTALRKLPTLAPEVIIMDIQLPDGSGIECTARLKRLLPYTEILMFTVYEDTEQIFKALEAGASGYLLKGTSSKELLRSVREIRAGGSPMTSEVARKVIQRFRKEPVSSAKNESLTRREEEVLELLAKGHLSKEIAHHLSISLETVNSHLKHIYEKLHVRSRTEAVLKYIQ